MAPERPFNLAVLGPRMSSSTWARSHRQGRSTQTGETGMRRGGGAGTLMSYFSCKTANSISPSWIHFSPVTSQHHQLKGSRLQDVNSRRGRRWWPVSHRVPTKPGQTSPPPILWPELSLRHQTQRAPMGSTDYIFTYSQSFPRSYIYTILTEDPSFTLWPTLTWNLLHNPGWLWTCSGLLAASVSSPTARITGMSHLLEEGQDLFLYHIQLRPSACWHRFMSIYIYSEC